MTTIRSFYFPLALAVGGHALFIICAEVHAQRNQCVFARLSLPSCRLYKEDIYSRKAVQINRPFTTCPVISQLTQGKGVLRRPFRYGVHRNQAEVKGAGCFTRC